MGTSDEVLALKALRWWRCSGARARHAREAVPYDTWCCDPSNDPLIDGDLEQIEKDVSGGRTDANVFVDEHLRLYGKLRGLRGAPLEKAVKISHGDREIN